MTAQTGLMGLTEPMAMMAIKATLAIKVSKANQGESGDAASLDFSTLASYFEGVSGVKSFLTITPKPLVLV